MTSRQQISQFLLPIATCGIIGLAAGFWFGWGVQANDMRSWEPLHPAPAEATELIPTGDRYIKVRTADGATYRYQDDPQPAWVADNDSLSPSAFMDVQKPCDPNAPAFTKATNPPSHWRDCVQQSMLWPEGSEEYIYIIDQNGVVWESFDVQYAGVDGAAHITVALVLGLMGLLAGSVVGIVIGLVRQKLGDRHKKQV